MLTQIINGHILTPQGWMKDGSVLISDGKILEVTNSDLAVIGAKVVDAKGMSIVPGFVAMNIHGGGGFDFSECTEEAFHGAVAAHQKHGATTIFPTVLAPEIGVIDKAGAVCEEMMRKKDGPILGLHIEGPYLNPKMAASLFIDKENPADPKEYKEILERTDCIKRWDSSPEIPGALEFAQYLKSRGILSAISHTEAEFDDIKTAYNAGFTHAAHFYNAMPGFHKRREYKYEGTVESVFLMDDMTVEVIADGRHLPSTILRLVYKLKGVNVLAWLRTLSHAQPTRVSRYPIPALSLRMAYASWRIILHWWEVSPRWTYWYVRWCRRLTFLWPMQSVWLPRLRPA